MFKYDPSVGTGSFLLMHPAVLSEMSLRVADAAAERGDDSMADAYWQLGVAVNNR